MSIKLIHGRMIIEGTEHINFIELLDTPNEYISADAGKILKVKDDFSGLDFTDSPKWLQNGFPNRTDSSISFNDGTRRFTINPSGASFDYHISGVKYTVSSSDVLNVNYVDISDTEGPWYIYYDGSTLTAAVSPNHAAVRDVYENKAAIAIVFWDADNNKGQLLEDRHGLSMSPLTHILIHETVGTRFDNGLALNSITADENGNVNSHAQFGVDAGQIFDEDIEHTLNAIGSTTGLQIWYRDTSGWTFTTNAGYSVIKTGVGGEDRLAYDNNGTLTEVSDNDFVLCHIFATSMAHLNPVVAVGQAVYATKKLAQQGALSEIVNILSIANISPELKPIASVIFQTKDTYSNTMKAKIVSTDEGDDYVDFRTDALNPAFSSAQSHSNLAGLGNDDHTQYLLADGTRALAGAWDMGSQALTNVNIDSGVITGITDLAIGDGGTGQGTAQLAINALSAVSGATNEHVLTKDTGTGNAVFKAATGGGGVPIGSMMMWTTDTAPSGWLLCYGQAISRTVTYDELYAVIGTTFGVGDGSTTFNLPDLRGRVPLGQDDMGGASANRVTHANADSIGGVEGTESHVLTTAELAVHKHILRGVIANANKTTMGGNVLAKTVGGSAYSNSLPTNQSAGDTSITNTGSGDAHTSMSPYITLNYIIKY